MDSDLEMDSDSDSVITSVTDLSVYHEFDQMIAELHTLQTTQNILLTQFEQLSSSITYITDDDKINIIYNNENIELDDFLDKINEESMEELKKTGNIQFGKLLLDRLDQTIFKS
jgi:hypothetical protein